ncbi:uncharacterized protein EHS24_003177 [Apiotrichum porosum]|uniref:VPS9 domain-containing protein n=1 Tax=Apiotrichum porosum TaxID=105984 RepID=A0A427XFS1_9TREE|nr:uncharacterized protein EHS24_003177 [Apiotrichum porosum]RSH77617.1 hypothetical protein EHS24_003177 [Apiotrichum porosum]
MSSTDTDPAVVDLASPPRPAPVQDGASALAVTLDEGVAAGGSAGDDVTAAEQATSPAVDPVSTARETPNPAPALASASTPTTMSPTSPPSSHPPSSTVSVSPSTPSSTAPLPPDTQVIASPPRRSSLPLAAAVLSDTASSTPAPALGAVTATATATPAPTRAASIPSAPSKPPADPAIPETLGLDVDGGHTPAPTPAPAGSSTATSTSASSSSGLASTGGGSAGQGQVKATPEYLRAAAGLEEFDPFATPPPAPRRSERPRPTVTTTPAAGSTLAGPFNFAGFLKDLRTKSADPVARYLKSFLTNFAKKPFTVNEQIKLIRDFLAFIGDKMKLVEPWRSQSPAEFDLALEAMEKLVMNRLYPYTFTPQLTAAQTITTDDLERDAVFAQRVHLFGWVRERHLDVPEGEAALGFLGFAEQELLKINHYKAPRDKMICILNCCKVIFGLIRHTEGGSAGADAFVPILIFVVLRASPDNMLSNVEYINRFRNPEKLQGEAGYYLSSLQGAIAFIETMDASSLSNITQEEFELNVEKAIQELPASPTSPRARASAPERSDMSPFATSPGEEPARALQLPNTSAALDGTKRFFQRTGDAAKEAVSRPISAIGKILENMQAAADEEGSESGDDEVVDRWAPGGTRDREAERRHHAPGGPMPVNMNRLRPHGQQQHQQHMDTPTRAPEHQAQPPSRLLAQLGLSPSVSENTSREPTPTPEYAAAQQQAYEAHQAAHFHAQQQQQQQQQQQLAMQSTIEASHEAYAREQARSASVLTLHQMFPALDEEIVGAVLASCGDDLGMAIDRLLEM